MKILLLCISLLAIAGCDKNVLFPDFEEGDCITLEGREEWERHTSIVKVLQVGKRKYKLEYVKPEILKGEEDNFNNIRQVDRIFEKVECPNE